jgi:ectoine hydroxylase-related dioxygenase (phytanoyl-CoA dioxygenase family)
VDWIVTVSYEERAFGALNATTTKQALDSLAENGCVLLRGSFQERVVDSLYREFMSRYGSLDAHAMAAKSKEPPPTPVMEVGANRFEIALKMTGAFAALEVFANPLLLRLLAPLLGNDLRLSGFTAVASYPGASVQHIHRDHAHLFADNSVGAQLPTYAVNVSVPLIDVDTETGPTGIWPGSQHLPDTHRFSAETATVEEFRRGDAILIDYRTFHTGMPNRSTKLRPILYMVYSRSWFFDEVNHTQRSSLDVPMETLRTMPAHMQSLLLRAYRAAHLPTPDGQ